jgi:dihydropteroate synthase
MILRLGEQRFEIERGAPLVMGIVNASPESFSDGGRYATLHDQVVHALELVEQGAQLIDVGGESGVTGIPAVAAEEEARRVVPLVERLAAEGVLVSVDTWKPSVARAALAAGAVLINDVSGLRDPALADACAEAGAGLVVMHTRAEPKVKAFPDYDDLVADVVTFVRERVALAVERGVEEERIVVDPGPDFAKTPEQTVAALRALDRLAALKRPILLAVSRKDFVGALTGRAPRDREAGTLAAVGAGVDAGAAIVRVHDVAATVDFLTVRAALAGERPVDPELRLPDELRRQPRAA